MRGRRVADIRRRSVGQVVSQLHRFRAKQNGSLLMVDFYTDWCGWCKKLDSDVYTDATVSTSSRKFASVKVNAEKEGLSLATKFHITGFPTIMFLDSSGNEFARIDGYRPAAEFAQTLDGIEKAWTDYPTLTSALKTNPNDGVSAAKLARIDAARGAVNDAIKLIDTVRVNAPDQLAATSNAIGDAAAEVEQVKSAATWYNMAIIIGKPMDEMVHAHVGLFRIASNAKDKAAMKAQLTAIIALPGIPDKLKTQVQAALTKLNAAG